MPLRSLVAADAPEHHLDVHAFVDLDEEFFDDAAAGVGFEQGQGRAASRRGWGCAASRGRGPGYPQHRLAATIDGLGGGEDADGRAGRGRTPRG